MKNLLLPFFLLSLFSAFAQNQRMVLFEHFTQASCHSCGDINPIIDPILLSNRGKIIPIKYQTSWPGRDPMNADNPDDVATRVDYYTVFATPLAVFDGMGPGGPISLVKQDRINSQSDIAAPFSIDLDYTISDQLDVMEITADIESIQSLSGNDLRLHIVVVEEKISFDTPPGTNTEKEFFNVMKKMLPDGNGTSLNSNWNIGQKESYQFSWNLENIYQHEQLAVVAFIQEHTDRVIHQAAFAESAAGAPKIELAAEEAIIFPNPTSANQVMFSFEVLEASDGEIIVLDTNGKVIFEVSHDFPEGRQEKEINMSGLPVGIYFAQMSTSKGEVRFAKIQKM